MRTFALLALFAFAGDEGKPAWMKYDLALKSAAAQDKLIAVFVPYECDQFPCPGGKCIDSIRIEDALKGKFENGAKFIVARADKKSSAKLGVDKPPALIVLDPDGLEMQRAGVGTAKEATDLLGKAAAGWAKKAVEWAELNDALFEEAKEKGEAVVLAFTTEKKESEELLKALEEPGCARLHERVRFAKVAFEKDAETAKLWGVTWGPALVMVDPAADRGAKGVLDRLAGKKPARDVKAFLARGLAKLEEKKK